MKKFNVLFLLVTLCYIPYLHSHSLHDTTWNEEINQIQKRIASKTINVNERNEQGYTILHFAVVKNLFEISKLLINHGANINAKTSHGYTPLQIALSNNLTEIAQLLLQSQANTNIKDNK